MGQIPWVQLATAAYSAYQSGRSDSKAKKAEGELENMKTPTYAPNQSILDYYQKALSRYDTQPTDSAEYKLQKQNIEQGTRQAISASRDRRLGGSLIPSVINNANNSLLKAAVSGEQRKARDLQVLGEATRMKSGEEGKAFNQNSVYPFEKNYNLMALKASGQTAVSNAALTNTYNNISAADAMYNPDGNYNWSSIFGTGNKTNNKTRAITASNKPKTGLNYIPYDERLPI